MTPQQKEFLNNMAKKYGLNKSDFWLHKQSGQWILSHDAVIKAAAKEGIQFVFEKWEDSPERKVMKVSAIRNGDAPVEMIGECRVGAKGITADYAWSMAQKRGEDRAALRIIAPGGGLYSEIEAEVFAKPEGEKQGLDAYAQRAKEFQEQ